uniref:(northern house mosquito) hypothetical protein n=1 Tax=Culex pipiens TaxID=7175 RepID=A0A8D8FG94_CULPI
MIFPQRRSHFEVPILDFLLRNWQKMLQLFPVLIFIAMLMKLRTSERELCIILFSSRSLSHSLPKFYQWCQFFKEKSEQCCQRLLQISSIPAFIRAVVLELICYHLSCFIAD